MLSLLLALAVAARPAPDARGRRSRRRLSPLQPRPAGAAGRRHGRGARRIPQGATARSAVRSDPRRRGAAAPADRPDRGGAGGGGSGGARRRRTAPESHLILAQLRHMQAQGDNSEPASSPGRRRIRRGPPPRARRRQTLFILASNVYPQLQDHDKAIATWKRFLELSPGSFDAYVQLGAQYLAKNDAEKRGGRAPEGGRARPDLAARLPDPGRHLRPRAAERPGHPELPQGARAGAGQRPPSPRAGRGAGARTTASGSAQGGGGRPRRRPQEPLRAGPAGAARCAT